MKITDLSILCKKEKLEKSAVYQILICPTVNVHYTVFCGHQRAAIMPGIETPFECMIVSLSLSRFVITSTGAAVLTTHFNKTGCLSVQNIPPRQVLVPPPPS